MSSFNKRAVAAAALAGVAFASPAPQQLNFAQIAAAPTVAQGPAVSNGNADQTASLYTSFSVAGATTAPSTAAAGTTPAPVQARAANKAVNAGWGASVSFGWSFPWFSIPVPAFPFPTPPGYATPSSTSSSKPTPPPYGGSPKTTSSKVTPTSAPAYSGSTLTTSVSVPAGTSGPYSPYYPALATSYTTDPALTGTTTAGQACPTTPEAGTYCGFINPEDPCSPQPDGYGPVPSPDTASAFLAYPSLHALASAAPTVVPSVNKTQYTQVFKDLNASVSGSSYLGLFTLKTYSAAQCAAYCDANSLCTAFNIFAERDPSLNPSANDSTAPTVWGYWCPNPPSMTSFKCTLWGSSISASMATNAGQSREQFQVVITASDGYDKTNVTVPSSPTCPSKPSSSPVKPTASVKPSSVSPSKPSSYPSPPNWPLNPWNAPKNCSGHAINAPPYWLGSQVFPGPFNPQVCSDYALAQTSANLHFGAGQVCFMFNAYFLFKNGLPWGTGCALYNSELDVSWATYAGASFQGDIYTCQQSWSFSLSAEAHAAIGF